MNDKPAVHVQHGRSEEHRAVMEEIIAAGDDPFEWENLARYHREPILKRGMYWLLTHNDYPYEGTKLHLLLIHRDRIRSFFDITPDMWSELGEFLAWIEAEFKLTYGAALLRFGDDAVYAGASVDHLHMHVIVGEPTDTGEKIRAKVGYGK